ncbi:hypothetical protein Droror1_Dr00000254 [Drosera rotundifolia]
MFRVIAAADQRGFSSRAVLPTHFLAVLPLPAASPYSAVTISLESRRRPCVSPAALPLTRKGTTVPLSS